MVSVVIGHEVDAGAARCTDTYRFRCVEWCVVLSVLRVCVCCEC